MPPVERDIPAVVANLGGHGALAAVRTLGRLGVEVHGVHSEKSAAAASSYLASTTIASPADLIATLDALAQRLGNRPVLFWAGDAETDAVAAAVDALARVFRMPVPRPGLIERLTNKEGLTELCAAHGVGAAGSYIVRQGDADALRKARQRVVYPVVVKAIQPALSTKRTVVVHTSAGLEQALETVGTDVIVQEFVPGVDWLYNAYFASGGTCVAGFTGRKIHQCPPGVGPTSYGVAEWNGEIHERVGGMLAAAGYEGVVDCDIRQDIRDGTFKLLDVNPRVGESFRMFVDENGLDVVRMQYLDLTGEPVTPGLVREGRQFAVLVNELVAYAQLENRPSPRAYFGVLRGVEEDGWVASDDLRPIGRIAVLTVRRALRRLRATVTARWSSATSRN